MRAAVVHAKVTTESKTFDMGQLPVAPPQVFAMEGFLLFARQVRNAEFGRLHRSVGRKRARLCFAYPASVSASIAGCLMDRRSPGWYLADPMNTWPPAWPARRAPVDGACRPVGFRVEREDTVNESGQLLPSAVQRNPIVITAAAIVQTRSSTPQPDRSARPGFLASAIEMQWPTNRRE